MNHAFGKKGAIEIEIKSNVDGGYRTTAFCIGHVYCSAGATNIGIRTRCEFCIGKTVIELSKACGAD